MNNLPVQHLSYSALRLFLTNRYAFRQQYILKTRTFKSSPRMVSGSAFHKALEAYYTGADQTKAMEAGLHSINEVSDDKIEWGKTGTREKIIKEFTNSFQFYFAEKPDVGEVLAAEKYITIEWEHEGVKGTIPLKVGIDLVTRETDGLVPRDHKTVTSFTDPESENPDYIIQSMFNFFGVKEFFKEEPVRMIYDEVKVSQNTDGSPQVRQYVIDFEKHPEYKRAFANLYADVCRELSRPDISFLPNFSDQLSGSESWEGYCMETINVEMPKVVHQTKAVPRYAEPKFNESDIDNYDNRNLEPQEMIRVKMLEFGIALSPDEVFHGANVTKYTFKPTRGVKMKTVQNHLNDISLALGKENVRLEAPIPGKKLIGVEVPNESPTLLKFDDYYKADKGTLNIPIGVDVYGELKVGDLSKMPHLLIAGATGSGKSVMISSIIKSLVGQNTPEQLGLVLIDPKRVELTSFKDLGHLAEGKLFFDEQEAILALQWACEIMDFRYKKLQKEGYRNVDDYNENNISKMKKYVIVIDEFADLMTGKLRKQTEHFVIRLAQLARAAGIHMVIATQRPTVQVVTGNIKTNMPARIAFSLPQTIDSMTILGESGAEKLNGKGDMLYMNQNEKGFQRLQGLYC